MSQKSDLPADEAKLQLRVRLSCRTRDTSLVDWGRFSDAKGLMVENGEFPHDPELSAKPIVSNRVDSVSFPDGSFMRPSTSRDRTRVIALIAPADLAARVPDTRAATFPDDIRDEQPETIWGPRLASDRADVRAFAAGGSAESSAANQSA